MEQVDYKEKYEDLIKRITKMANCQPTITKLAIESLFPELKEPEDEKIRSALLRGFNSMYANQAVPTFAGEPIRDILAWLEKQGEKDKFIEKELGCIKGYRENAIKRLEELEKQGEQKPADKVEQKFKVGDKVLVDGKVYTIKLVNEDNYIVDENGRDVQEHFSYTKDWKLYEQKPTAWSEEDEMHIRELERLVKQVWAIAEHENNKDTIHKMSDLSFFLKTLKPQLKQDEQKPVVDTKVIIPKFRVGDIVKSKSQPMLSPRKIISIGKDCYWCEDRGCIGFAWEDDCEIVEQNHAWSGEDETALGDALWCCKQAASIAKNENDMGNVWYAETWLKAIKDRVQPKQEWSKEDRRHIEKLILNVNAKEFPDEVDWLISLHEKIAPPYWDKEDEEMLNQAIQEVEYALNDKNIAFSGREPVLLWLKHLRPQSQWKPSEEQIKALKEACDKRWESDGLDPLYTLWEQLKKLRKE